LFRNQQQPKKKILLLLDTGDNCRCPMAKGYLSKLLEERGIDYIEIKTAGVMTPTGLKPQEEAVLLLKEEGVDITDHRSRPVSAQLIEEADLILGMSSIHVQNAYRKSPAARGKTFLIKEYVGYQGKNVLIQDPMGGTMEIFKKCFEQIKDALEKFVETDFVKTPPPGWRQAQDRQLPAEADKPELSAIGTPSEPEVVATPPIADSPEATVPVKRKRGRPPKSEKQPEAPKEATQVQPRKRGRPKKSESVKVTAGEAELTIRQGRRKKEKVVAAEAAEAKRTSQRGRAKKEKPISHEEGSTAPSSARKGRKAASTHTAKTKVSDKATAKKRGRPSKADTAKKTTAARKKTSAQTTGKGRRRSAQKK
jgi:protein-tyrosine phosphatase